MSNNHAYSKYKQTSVMTASKGKLLLMLYESCIKHTKMAIQAVHAKNLTEKGKCILKIQDIVNELSLSLDHSIGGEISKELDRLYTFIVDQLTEANVKNDAKPLDTILKIFQTLYEGWVVAVEKAEKGELSGVK